MFDYLNDANSQALEEAITKLLEEMKSLDGNSEEYTKAADNLVKLIKLKNDSIKLDNEYDKIEIDRTFNDARSTHEDEKLRFERDLEEEKLRFEQEKIRSWKPSSDALVGAAASVLGIVLVLNYEKLGVITSKAFTFLGKMR